MNIRSIREMNHFAAGRLSHARDHKRIILIYAGLTLGLTAVVMVVNFLINMQMDQLGGLRHLATRRLLSSIQSMLPLGQSLFNLCLGVGLVAAMLRVARGQYVSPNTLRLGFDRFWVLLRYTIIQGLLYSAVVCLGIYLGILIYMATPLSNDAMALLMPYLSETTVLNSALVLPEAEYIRFAEMIWPAYLICGLVVALLALPMVYGYRMTTYIIIDRPGLGAMAALRESKQMMRGQRLRLLKLDVSLWWYYLAMALAMAVGDGSLILSMLGIQLPWSETLCDFLFFGLYLAVSFGVYWLLLARVEVTYALFYDSVKPEPKQDGGVVLGNIFNM